MAAKDLRSILNSSGLTRGDTDAIQRVQVKLATPAATDQTLERLRASGLQIDSTIGNTISGTIQGKNRKILESLDEVAGVEDVVKLKPHTRQPG